MSFSVWKNVKIKDVAETIFSGGTPSTKKEEFWNGKINWLSSGETRNKFIVDTEKKITQEGVDNSSTKLAKKKDVVIASAGQGFTRGQTSMCLIDTYINQSLICVRAKKDIIDPYYLFYNISSRYNELRQISDGHSIRGSLTTKLISDLNISLPTIDEQRKIREILFSIDNKIETNNEINKKLEEMAQAIFKQWFVDFEFPNEDGKPYKSSGGEMVESELGMIPKGWEVISLDKLMDYQGGSQPPSSEFKESFEQGYIRLVQIRDYDGDNHITYIPITSKLKLCNKYDIMLARYGAALGRVMFGLDGAYNVAIAKIIPKNPIYREWLRCYLNTDFFYRTLNNKGQRSAQSGFNQSDISSFKITFPVITDGIIDSFEKITSNIFEERLIKKDENNNLVKLRNALLPKLMSGEIRVPLEQK